MLEILKLLITTLGAKRVFRILAIALFVATSFVILVQLDLIPWTMWWLVPTLLLLYLGSEMLIATLSMADSDAMGEKKNEGNRPRHKKRTK